MNSKFSKICDVAIPTSQALGSRQRQPINTYKLSCLLEDWGYPKASDITGSNGIATTSEGNTVDIELGGTLEKDTLIETNGNSFGVTGANGFSLVATGDEDAPVGILDIDAAQSGSFRGLVAVSFPGGGSAYFVGEPSFTGGLTQGLVVAPELTFDGLEGTVQLFSGEQTSVASVGRAALYATEQLGGSPTSFAQITASSDQLTSSSSYSLEGGVVVSLEPKTGFRLDETEIYLRKYLEADFNRANTIHTGIDIQDDYVQVDIKKGAGSPTGTPVDAYVRIYEDRVEFNDGTNGWSMPLGTPEAFDDDAAAATGGIASGTVYQTTGSGAAPLNTPGILMIKQ